MLNDEKRGVEEAYTSAMTSSNLRVEADVRGDADVLIAAGWNQSRIGGARTVFSAAMPGKAIGGMLRSLMSDGNAKG